MFQCLSQFVTIPYEILRIPFITNGIHFVSDRNTHAIFNHLTFITLLSVTKIFVVCTSFYSIPLLYFLAVLLVLRRRKLAKIGVDEKFWYLPSLTRNTTAKFNKRKILFSSSAQGIRMIHENKYANDYVLKSTKNSAIKSKRKNMKTCPVQLLVQAATESYLIHCATNNGTLVILMSFNLSGECISK